MRVLLVGQAPGRASDAALAFQGDSGRRLAKLLDVPFSELPLLFDARNLLPRWPGKSGKGDSFPVSVARIAASLLLATDDHRVVLFAGKKVSAAFGFADLEFLRWAELGTRRVAVIPHPSGVSRWWNDPTNRRAARRFLRAALAR